MNQSKKIAWFIFAIVFIATWIKPIWPYEQALHTSLTVVGVVLLWWCDRRYQLSALSFILIVLFLTVHTVAAYWLYSNVPYDSWAKVLFGQSLSDMMGWQRNHFDRFVHFLYGLCFAPALIHIVQTKWRARYRTAWLVTITAIMVSSLWYEWFEWIVAISLSPEDTEAYNGQQGDIWDAHKDMALATIGAVIPLFWKRKGHTL
jgi:putative membrane protein